MGPRKHDHVGLATNDLEKTLKFYIDELGFKVYGETVCPDGTPIKFITNGDLKYEIYQPVGGVKPEDTMKVDHMSFVSDDIEKDYDYFMKKGYECVTNGIEGIENAWDHGCRYFKVKGPSGEDIEFDQIL